jgi:Xaa-Pro aminopeptidase
MSLDVAAVQAALQADALDGWLLYDFHGSNPVAQHLAGLSSSGKMTTRRWYYFIPAKGSPRGLVHAIERHNLDGLPGDKRVYAGRSQLAAGLDSLLAGAKRVAMEYSPDGDIPYLARVDAGTVESIRRRGIDVVSSGDLVQRFDACWTDEEIATHREASKRLYRIKDETFELIADKVRKGERPTEYEIQQIMAGWFREAGLVTDAPPVVAVDANAGDPHYMPQPSASATIGPDQLVLLDLWGKLDASGSVYADITWVGHTGAHPSDEQQRAFSAIVAARDAAVDLVQRAARARTDLRGWQVDRAAREVLEREGYGAHVIHRTGHSLGQSVHGNGVHMDDFETHDDRRLLPGAGFTIEPGLYFEAFGVRTEINMVYGDGDAEVTGPRQSEIVRLG